MRFALLIGVFTLCQALPGTRDLVTKRAGDLKVVLLADTNRDGQVDVTGDSDRGAGKATWTAESGALFLAAIADTDRRCSSQITGKCASTLGDIFRENVVPVPQPTLLPYEQWQRELDRLQASTDPMDQAKLQAYPDYDVEVNGYADRMREWEWATSDGALIERCHDATDNVLRNPALLAPLRTVPKPGLSATATGAITVSDKTAASKVRVFHNKGGGDQWVYVSPDYVFSAQDLQAGLTLGVDGRDVRRPGGDGWDGRALVNLTVRDGDNNSTADDSVALRVAPVLTHHHGQPAEQLFGSTDGLPHREAFIQDLEAVSSRHGMQNPLHVFNNTQCSYTGGPDTWTQDFFEPGYTSIPGPDGGRPVGLRILMRSAQSSREAGRTLFQTLRSDAVGAVQHIRSALDDDTVESMGNLETIPPHTAPDGVAYPAGRAVMGSQSGEKPVMMGFLEAQEAQKPLQLDTSWLQVGHVDEFLQFLPVNQSERTWTVVVDDPAAGLALLQEAQRAGHGKVKAVSRPGRPSDPTAKRCTPTDTVDEVLGRADFATFQATCAKAIQANIEILKRETGITDAEIIRLPALFWPKFKKLPPWQCEEKEAKSRRDEEDKEEEEKEEEEEEEEEVPEGGAGLARRITYEYAALWPGIVNGVVLGNGKVLAPNPWGPVVDGKDMLVEAANAAYAKANFTVEYMDDWYSQHVRTGEVHCATNALREVGGKWW